MPCSVRVVALASLTLISCRLDLSGAPCSFDENCPSGQRCDQSLNSCVFGDGGSVGGGTVSAGGGGAGGGTGSTGGGTGEVGGGAGGSDGGEVGDGGLTSTDAGIDAGSAVGVGCTTDAECASNFCTDGVCCEARCQGACEVCSSTGTCAAADAGITPLPRHDTCAVEAMSTCGRDGTCDGVGRCALWSGVVCEGARCSASGAIAASTCDGVGGCSAPAPTACGNFVCADGGCATACRQGDDSLCQPSLSCVGTTCSTPTCTDGVANGLETGVDCGGPATDGGCSRCGSDAGCRGPLDCLSGTCQANQVCSSPTYVWNATAFSSCSAAACNAGTQTRAVTCLRSDGLVVADMFCGGAKPPSLQACLNLTGCAWNVPAYGGCSTTCGSGTQTRIVVCRRPDGSTAPDSYCPAPKPATLQTCFLNSSCSWFVSAFGACSVRCGSGTAMRTVYCQNSGGGVVPDTFCPTAKPTTLQGCSGPPCTVYTLGHPTAANGPCFAPSCTGPQPVAPACPAGYASTRYEEACGNPSACGGVWALCTFSQQAGYGCTGTGFVTRVSVRQCTYQ